MLIDRLLVADLEGEAAAGYLIGHISPFFDRTRSLISRSARQSCKNLAKL